MKEHVSVIDKFNGKSVKRCETKHRKQVVRQFPFKKTHMSITTTKNYLRN